MEDGCPHLVHGGLSCDADRGQVGLVEEDGLGHGAGPLHGAGGHVSRGHPRRCHAVVTLTRSRGGGDGFGRVGFINFRWFRRGSRSCASQLSTVNIGSQGSAKALYT